MPETIEIECNDRSEIKRLKQQLKGILELLGTSLEEVSTKETKEDQAMRVIEEYEQLR